MDQIRAAQMARAAVLRAVWMVESVLAGGLEDRGGVLMEAIASELTGSDDATS
jgi:hypothetical protein